MTSAVSCLWSTYEVCLFATTCSHEWAGCYHNTGQPTLDFTECVYPLAHPLKPSVVVFVNRWSLHSGVVVSMRWPMVKFVVVSIDR